MLSGLALNSHSLTSRVNLKLTGNYTVFFKSNHTVILPDNYCMFSVSPQTSNISPPSSFSDDSLVWFVVFSLISWLFPCIAGGRSLKTLFSKLLSAAFQLASAKETLTQIRKQEEERNHSYSGFDNGSCLQATAASSHTSISSTYRGGSSCSALAAVQPASRWSPYRSPLSHCLLQSFQPFAPNSFH